MQYKEAAFFFLRLNTRMEDFFTWATSAFSIPRAMVAPASPRAQQQAMSQSPSPVPCPSCRQRSMSQASISKKYASMGGAPPSTVMEHASMIPQSLSRPRSGLGSAEVATLRLPPVEYTQQEVEMDIRNSIGETPIPSSPRGRLPSIAGLGSQTGSLQPPTFETLQLSPRRRASMALSLPPSLSSPLVQTPVVESLRPSSSLPPLSALMPQQPQGYPAMLGQQMPVAGSVSGLLGQRLSAPAQPSLITLQSLSKPNGTGSVSRLLGQQMPLNSTAPALASPQLSLLRLQSLSEPSINESVAAPTPVGQSIFSRNDLLSTQKENFATLLGLSPLGQHSFYTQTAGTSVAEGTNYNPSTSSLLGQSPGTGDMMSQRLTMQNSGLMSNMNRGSSVSNIMELDGTIPVSTMQTPMGTDMFGQPLSGPTLVSAGTGATLGQPSLGYNQSLLRLSPL